MWVGKRSGSRTRHQVLLIGLLVVLTCAAVGRSTCPDSRDIYPCVCSVKNKGLDVICENTDAEHVKKAMQVFKAKPVVIFYLKVRQNNMPKLQDYIFLGMDIRHLIIINSNLAVIEEAALSPLGTRMQNLDLSTNKMKAVPSAALHKLHELTFLNLNHNKITILHDKAFDGLARLERLSLYGNMISKIEDNAFVGLERELIRLNLGSNQLSSIPTLALSRLSSLDKLELPENQINNIEEGDLTGLPKLDSLNLMHNKISHLKGGAFKELRNLNSLNLEYNSIVHIDDDAFEGLEAQLEWLTLGNNNIHVIPSAALRRLHRLRQLDLRSNNISHVEEDAFQGFGETIKFLYLQKNKIKTIPTMALSDLHSLEWLYLFTNNLNHLPEDVMEPVLDTLKVMDLHDNPLVCDCDLRWYKEWLESKQDVEEDRPLLKETQCSFPLDRHDYSLRNIPLDKMFCTSPRIGQTGTAAILPSPSSAILALVTTTALIMH